MRRIAWRGWRSSRRRRSAAALALAVVPAVAPAAAAPVAPPPAAPSPAGPPPWIRSLSVAPSDAVVGVGAVRTFTVSGHSDPDDKAEPVDVTKWAVLTGSGPVSCVDAGCRSNEPGAYMVRVSLRVGEGPKDERAVVSRFVLTVVPVQTVRMVPEDGRIQAGEVQGYAVRAYREVGDPESGQRVVQDLGELTDRTAFAVDPPATCSTAGSCTAERTGSYRVVGTVLGFPEPVRGRLEVTPGDPVTLELSPAESTVALGASVEYQVRGVDRYGNDTGDLTGDALLTAPPPAWCDGMRCGATETGTFVVTGRLREGSATGAATLHVTPQRAARLQLDPLRTESVAGGRRAFTATALDAEGRSLGDVTDRTTFSIEPTGSCEDSSCGAEKVGTYRIVGRLAGSDARGEALLTVRPGEPAQLTLAPPEATVTAGAVQEYRLGGVDAHGNDVGDLTAAADFSIGPAGSCTGSRCSADAPGDFTVTATVLRYELSRSVTLHVRAGPVATLELSPPDATVVVGARQPYTVRGQDRRGNDVGDVTGSAVLRISEGGSCRADGCTATVPGEYTVTAERPGADGGRPARLTVRAGRAAALRLEPGSASIPAGGTVRYRVLGFDRYGNAVGDVTAVATFSVAPEGSCTREQCTARRPGEHEVTASVPGAVEARGRLTVSAGPVARIRLHPDGSTVAAGAARTFRAEGFDPAGNSVGDVTRTVAFSIGPSGSCAAAQCIGSAPGDHTVVGRLVGTDVTDTVTLHVVASRPDEPTPPVESVPDQTVTRLVLEPRTASITSGAAQDYRVRAFGPGGTDLGDVTAQAALSVLGEGSCTAGRCTATRPGRHAVVAVFGDVRAGATLEVVAPDEMTELVVDPAEASVTVGAEQAYRVRALDANGTDLGDFTEHASLAIEAPGRCAAARCTAGRSGDLEVTATVPGRAAVGRAVLHVLSAEPAWLKVDPASGVVAPGDPQPFRVRGLDADRNDLGELTTRTAFAIDPSGSCTAAVCVAPTAGDHTVTATVTRRQGPPVVATVPLRVVEPNPGGLPLAWLALAGGAFLLLAAGFVLARAPALPGRHTGRHRTGSDRRGSVANGTSVRAEPRPTAARLTLQEGPEPDRTWAVRIEPHPDPPATSMLEKGIVRWPQ
jgi:hypothetical protein